MSDSDSDLELEEPIEIGSRVVYRNKHFGTVKTVPTLQIGRHHRGLIAQELKAQEEGYLKSKFLLELDEPIGRNDGTLPVREAGEIVVDHAPDEYGRDVETARFRSTGTTVKKDHGVFASIDEIVLISTAKARAKLADNAPDAFEVAVSKSFEMIDNPGPGVDLTDAGFVTMDDLNEFLEPFECQFEDEDIQIVFNAISGKKRDDLTLSKDEFITYMHKELKNFGIADFVQACRIFGRLDREMSPDTELDTVALELALGKLGGEKLHMRRMGALAKSKTNTITVKDLAAQYDSLLRQQINQHRYALEGAEFGEQPHIFRVNDSVEVNYRDHGIYYPAIIHFKHDEMHFDVLYHDDVIEFNVPKSRIRDPRY